MRQFSAFLAQPNTIAPCEAAPAIDRPKKSELPQFVSKQVRNWGVSAARVCAERMTEGMDNSFVPYTHTHTEREWFWRTHTQLGGYLIVAIVAIAIREQCKWNGAKNIHSHDR